MVDADSAPSASRRPVYMTPAVSRYLRQRGIVAMRADWTHRSSEVDALLRGLQQDDIPALAIYSPRRPDGPVVVSRQLTDAEILAAIDSALAEH